MPARGTIEGLAWHFPKLNLVIPVTAERCSQYFRELLFWSRGKLYLEKNLWIRNKTPMQFDDVVLGEVVGCFFGKVLNWSSSGVWLAATKCAISCCILYRGGFVSRWKTGRDSWRLGSSHVTWKCTHCFLELKTSQDTVGLLEKSVRGCQTRSIFAKKASETEQENCPRELMFEF